VEAVRQLLDLEREGRGCFPGQVAHRRGVIRLRFCGRQGDLITPADFMGDIHLEFLAEE
jgi:hypothetical protein